MEMIFDLPVLDTMHLAASSGDSELTWINCQIELSKAGR